MNRDSIARIAPAPDEEKMELHLDSVTCTLGATCTVSGASGEADFTDGDLCYRQSSWRTYLSVVHW